MRCFPRPLTFVVSIIILLFTTVWGAVLDERKAEEIVKRKVEVAYGSRVRVVEITPYLREPIIYRKIREVRLKVRRGSPGGHAYIYLKTDEGEKVVTVGLKLLWLCEFYVLSENVGRGERIYPWMVVLKRSFMERCPHQSIEDPGELINYVALKPLRKGDPVKRSRLKPEPLVRRGDEVNVIYRRGNLEISFPGEALENGFYGERIRVRSANTGKILRCKVVGEGTVVVE